MLTMKFETMMDERVRETGPAARFQLVGGSAREGPTGRPQAVYHHGRWEMDGEQFVAVTVGEHVTVHFERGDACCAGPFGPFPEIRITDGFIRYGPGFREILARLDEQAQAWYVLPDGIACRSVVLEAVPEHAGVGREHAEP